MEKLEALPCEANIEVVVNVVYLYAPQKYKAAAAGYYGLALEVLREV